MREMFVANCKFCMHEYHVIVGMSFGIRVVLLVLGSFPLAFKFSIAGIVLVWKSNSTHVFNIRLEKQLQYGHLSPCLLCTVDLSEAVYFNVLLCPASTTPDSDCTFLFSRSNPHSQSNPSGCSDIFDASVQWWPELNHTISVTCHMFMPMRRRLL